MKKSEKILLALLPFWTPLIPPQGIASLKSYLQGHGYRVKAVDANIEETFKEIYEMYFGTLRSYIPEDRQGNFFRVGHELLKNHMTAQLHYTDKNQYLRLIELMVYRTYYTHLDKERILKLTDIIDRFYGRLEKYLIELLHKESPTVLGLSATVGTLPASLFAFKLAKERYPRLMTVLGGCVFTWGLPQSPDFEFFLQKTPYIDKIIIGEGEILFLKLLQGQLPASQRVFSLKDIGGETVNLESIDIPDISDFDIHHYPYIAAFGSVSCPFKCSFCIIATFYGKYRRKGLAQIVGEMTTLYKKYGPQLFFMNDSLLNCSITALAKMLLKSDIPFYMDGFLRVDDSIGDMDQTLLWRQGGLYRARIGLESGSQHVLDLMKKKITVEQSRKAITSLAHAGIKTSAYFVVGFPGETEEDFQQTLDFIEELRNYFWQVDGTPFMYHYAGQADSDQWASRRRLLYPAEFRDMLVIQSWILEGEPDRRETFERMNRFVQHCKRLGIPNPFSLPEHYEADARWRRLHANAVPPMVAFKSGALINECRSVKKLMLARNTRQEDGDFVF